MTHRETNISDLCEKVVVVQMDVLHCYFTICQNKIFKLLVRNKLVFIVW